MDTSATTQEKEIEKRQKWNAQQRENFEWLGDIYCGVPYKNYRNVDIGPPVANVPLQQHVVQLPVAIPNILPAPPTVFAAAAANYKGRPQAPPAQGHSGRGRANQAAAKMI
jgi:hypothetical protein